MRPMLPPAPGYGIDPDMLCYFRARNLGTTASPEMQMENVIRDLTPTMTGEARTMFDHIDCGAASFSEGTLAPPSVLNSGMRPIRIGELATPEAIGQGDVNRPLFFDILQPTGVAEPAYEISLGFWYAAPGGWTGSSRCSFFQVGDALYPTSTPNIGVYAEDSATNGLLDFKVMIRDSDSEVRTVTFSDVPSTGFFGISISNLKHGFDMSMRVTAYHGGLPLGSFGDLSFNKLGAQNMPGSQFFWRSDSDRTAAIGMDSGSRVNTRFFDISEIVMYGRDIGDHGFRRLYRNSVKPWDDYALINTEPKAYTRVILEDGIDINLTQLDGFDYVKEVEVSEEADSEGATAKFQLFRRKGKHQDLSPIPDEDVDNEYEEYIKLNRKVRIERAIVPHMWRVGAWEWETIFQGHIRKWSYNEYTIDVECADLSAPLRDAQVLDNRAYSYYRTPYPMERFMNKLLRDYSTTTFNAEQINSYFGYPSHPWKNYPRVHGVAGNYYLPPYNNSLDSDSRRVGGLTANFNLLYHDAPAGSVWDALKAVSDQIGFDTKFTYVPYADEYRLMCFDPVRETYISGTEDYLVGTLRVVSGSSDWPTKEILVTTAAPHGLTVGTNIDFDSTPQSAFEGDIQVNCNVIRILSAIEFVCTPSDGTHSFDTHASIIPIAELKNDPSIIVNSLYTYSPNSIQGFSDIEVDLENIRNAVSIKYNRVPDGERAIKLRAMRVFQNGTTHLLGHGNPFRSLDLDGNGISIQIEGYNDFQPNDELLNTTWTWRRPENPILGDGNNILILNELAPVALRPVSGFTDYSYSPATWKSPYVRYEEVFDMDRESADKYGLRPCAIYEGSTVGLNEREEAERLARTVLNDLANPTADLEVSSKVYPFELSDFIGLPYDRKNRYPQNKNIFTVVGKTERYSNGVSQADYTLRVGVKPTRGRAWTNKMLTQFGAPVPPSNFTLADRVLEVDAATTLARRIGYGIKRDGIEMTPIIALPEVLQKEVFRMESYKVYAGGSATFVPGSNDELASVSSNGSTQIEPGKTTAAGTKVTPGAPIYLKTVPVDKFGNPGPMDGLANEEEAALVVPRFKPVSAGAKLYAPADADDGSSSGGHHSIWWGAFTQSFLRAFSLQVSSIDYGYNTFDKYDISNRRFRMPCTGTVEVTAEISARLSASGTSDLLCRVAKYAHNSATTLVSVSPTQTVTLTNITYGAANRYNIGFLITATSGQYIALEWRKSGTPNVQIATNWPTHVNAGWLHFNLVSEDRARDDI